MAAPCLRFARLHGSAFSLLVPRAPLHSSPRAFGGLQAAGIRLFSALAPRERPRPNIQESTEEYVYVERLIPPTQVPAPPPHTGPTPSGWTPPAPHPPALPYMVRRSRMHNVPVYRDTTHGNRLLTIVRRIQGDIWALDQDLREHLGGLTGNAPPTQVNEVTMTIKVKGHYEAELKAWLQELGF